LAREVDRLILVGRREEKLIEEQADLQGMGAAVSVCTDLTQALHDSDMVLAVTSALDTIVEPEMLKAGAVVCDVARPRDVSTRVAAEREDVLVIEGGAVAVPGEVAFNLDFGFPPGLAYACMAETMILALEGHTADYSLGKELELERVKQIQEWAEKHGFRLAGFRSFERAVEQEDIARVKKAREQYDSVEVK
jgi:predicted amino acid dehydrogenase